MDPIKIIEKYYDKDSELYKIVLTHSQKVADKAIEIAMKNKHLNLDIEFIKEAAMLHDIGIFLTNADTIHCHGGHPYICHGILGAEILRKEGLPKHALVCERHMIIPKKNIMKKNLPLPLKDYFPETNEEKIIYLADHFFTKSRKHTADQELTIKQAEDRIGKFGKDKIVIFRELLKKFNMV